MKTATKRGCKLRRSRDADSNALGFIFFEPYALKSKLRLHQFIPRLFAVAVDQVRHLELEVLFIIPSFGFCVKDNLGVLAAVLDSVAGQVVYQAVQHTPVGRHLLAAIAVTGLVDRELHTEFINLHFILEGLHQVAEVVADRPLTEGCGL